ncbi:MAG: hypothetical protein AAFU65_03825 [Pseudomonadota bacterium]
MDELSYLSRPPGRTHGPLLDDLHALNRQFLDLLIEHEAVADTAGLSSCTQQSLHGLGPRELERMATCPYSLFDLAFSEPAQWRRILNEPPQRGECPPTVAGAFALAALLYTRQLCQHHDGMARLLLGMTEDVLALLAAQDLPTLTACAFCCVPPLRARLADHPHFWSDLVDFVRDGTRERQLAAHTLGMQHSAAKFPR